LAQFSQSLSLDKKEIIEYYNLIIGGELNDCFSSQMLKMPLILRICQVQRGMLLVVLASKLFPREPWVGRVLSTAIISDTISKGE
jgi:hypothetical protein